jgi:hypothetical protein
MIKYPHIKKNAQQFCIPPHTGLGQTDPHRVHLVFEKFAHGQNSCYNTGLMLRITQWITAVLACVLCVFIIGPIAAVIQSLRLVRSWLGGAPLSRDDHASIMPLIVTFLITTSVLYILF